MADSPVEVKPDRDTTVDAVCDLIKGATLLKAGRSVSYFMCSAHLGGAYYVKVVREPLLPSLAWLGH